MKTTIVIAFGVIILALQSCITTSKMTTEKDLGVEPLKRSDYTITEDKEAEATVTQTMGLFYDNKEALHKKGIIKMHTGNLTIGSFNVNVTGILFASAVTIGTTYFLSTRNLNTWRYAKHSVMVDANNNVNNGRGGSVVIHYRYIPNSLALLSGIAVGFGLNAILAPSPCKKAEDYAKYKLITENKFDYIVNPRFELVKNNSLFKKSATVKITAKGMNIITNK